MGQFWEIKVIDSWLDRCTSDWEMDLNSKDPVARSRNRKKDAAEYYLYFTLEVKD